MSYEYKYDYGKLWHQQYYNTSSIKNYYPTRHHYPTYPYSDSYQYSSKLFHSLQEIKCIPISLRNYGANCYLNSGLQAISACSNFVNDFNDCQMKNPNLQKLETFNNLINILVKGNANMKSIDLSQDKIFDEWNKTGQQDSFELLAFVINQIYNEFKKFSKPSDWLNVRLPMRVILEHHITCCSEYGSHDVKQSEIALHIPIVKNNRSEADSVILQDLIENFFKDEPIEDFICDSNNCLGKNARKQMKLCLPLPNTMCIHLQRLHFTANNIMKKIEDHVKFDKQLIISKTFCKLLDSNSTSLLKDYNYYLKSVIVHSGNDSFGHYICYKQFNDSWFYTSDSLIYEEDFDRVLNCQAYILFYEKSSCEQNSQLLPNLEEEISKNKACISNVEDSVKSTQNSVNEYNMPQSPNKSMEVDLRSQNNLQSLDKREYPNKYSQLNTNSKMSNDENSRREKKEIFNENWSHFSISDNEISQNKYFISNIGNNVKPPQKSIIGYNYAQIEDNSMELVTETENIVKGLTSTSHTNQHQVDMNNKVSLLSEDFSKLSLNVHDSSKDANKFISSVDRFELSIEENILIQALSSCDHFLQSISELRTETMSVKNQKLVKFIMENNYPLNLNGFSSNKSFNILKNLKNIIRQIFTENSQANSSRESPLHFHFKELHYCYNKYKSMECEKSELIFQSNYLKFDIQFLMDHCFREFFPIETRMCCLGSTYTNYLLLEPLPKIVCIHIFSIYYFQLERNKQFKIKNSNIYNENVASKGSFNHSANQYSLNIYFLKSFVIRNGKEYECYRIVNGELIHVSCNGIQKVDYKSYLFGDEITLFYELDNRNYPIINEKNTLKHIEAHNEKHTFPSTVNESNNYGANRSNYNSNDFYLETCFHALSGCNNLINKLQNIVDEKMEKSSSMLKIIKLMDGKSNIPMEVIDKFSEFYETNLYHMYHMLLSNLSKEWNQNPFLISKQTDIYCSQCKTLQSSVKDSQMSINIPIASSDDFVNIQDFVNSYFEMQILKNFDCANDGCFNRKDSKMLSKLCWPIPTVICIHIERLIWDGVKNIIFNPEIRFRDCLRIKKEYLDIAPDFNHKNENLIYSLKSMICFAACTNPTEYYCCKRISGDWYRITNNPRRTERTYELSDPYIMLYELEDR